ncbi:beta-ketoacyl-[acyl-carrier-protein] synthase family protein [soil metagenome]
MKPLAVSDFTLVSALGRGRAVHLAALREGRSGLAPCDFAPIDDEPTPLDTWVGAVVGVDDVVLPPALADWDCRNNRLAWLGLETDGFRDSVDSAIARWGSQRVGVFMGTSTSGIMQTELAYRRRDPVSGALPPDFHYAETHNTFSVGDFVRHALGITGPAFVVSAACSSSAKVYGNAARMIEIGLIDAAVVGGVDSLCLTTLHGFASLEVLSREACRPFDADRAGISIGEAASFALLERESAAPVAWLRGVGESSDGYHMSSPLPDGAGAARAMREALDDAGLQAMQIDYINLHGTATRANDAAEDAAVASVFGPGMACSSTKGATGHTLGAAGGIEAAIVMLSLAAGLKPGGLNVRQVDPALQCRYLTETESAPVTFGLSNSFGFGGSNSSLVFGAS